MDTQFIRDRITSLRIEHDISERHMSLDMGKAHNYIHSISSGKMLPTMESFLDICKYFKISPKNFFDIDLENPMIYEEIMSELKRLSNDHMQTFLTILKTTEPSEFESYLKFIEKLQKNS